MNLKKSKKEKKIGIIGGLGPFAGLDLNKKIFNNTLYRKDQDHLEVILYSGSPKINDRTEYLLTPNKIENPAYAVAKITKELYQLGIRLLAIPCNTFHAQPIFNVFQKELKKKKLNQIEVVHLIDNLFKLLKKENFKVKTLGLLATIGTYLSGVYQETATREKINLLLPSLSNQKKIHAAIYDPSYGIKSYSSPISPKSIQVMTQQYQTLIKRGAQGVIMGCTEIPLALENISLKGIKIDPTDFLARTLVEKANPSKLRRN